MKAGAIFDEPDDGDTKVINGNVYQYVVDPSDSEYDGWVWIGTAADVKAGN